MKIYNPLPCLIIIIFLLANTGCEKDPIESRPGNPNPNTPDTSNTQNIPDTSNTPNTPDTPDIPDIPVAGNTPPIAHTSGDLMVVLPVNETFLDGSCSDRENNINGFTWTKISGPDSYTLKNKNALGTKLSGLEKGVYQFELTVTDAKGLYDKDTMKVIVGEISANPTDIVFKNLVWDYEGPHGTLLWGTIATVKDIYNYLPAGSIFKVYLQTINSPGWTVVPQYDDPGNAMYTFFIKNGHLHVYSGSDEPGTANLKIVY